MSDNSKFQRRHYIAIANTFVAMYNLLAMRPSRYWKVELRAIDDMLNFTCRTFAYDNYGFDESRFRQHIAKGTHHPERSV